MSDEHQRRALFVGQVSSHELALAVRLRPIEDGEPLTIAEAQTIAAIEAAGALAQIAASLEEISASLENLR